jgi:hypothetical protein
MKFVFHGDHDGEKVGIDPGVLDGHQRPLINPSVVTADSPRAAFLITAGKNFTIDHKDYARGLNWVADYMRSHKNFRCLDSELRPPEGKIGVGIEFPKKTEPKR